MFLHKRKNSLFGSKTFGCFDIGLIKLSVFAFALFLVSYFPQIASVELRWFWLVVFILAAIRPLGTFWKR